MSIPDVMQRCLRTAGVPSNAAPVSSNMGVYPDGTIALFMLYKPGPPHREGKDRLRSSAGMRQLGSASAGKSQLHNNSSAGSRQPSPHHQESTHRSHSSAGMRQPSVTSAGKSQLLITSTAGSRQPSPEAFRDSSACLIACPAPKTVTFWRLGANMCALLCAPHKGGLDTFTLDIHPVLKSTSMDGHWNRAPV